jgi:hypothetical protein
VICPACREAADVAPWELELLGFDKVPPHDPAICVNAAHTDQDIRLFGRKCPCQHGRNDGQQAATEGNDRG